MPRRVRLHLEGAFYHVMARGNRKQQVFHEVSDYSNYLDLMHKYSQRFGVEVHGYALMPNHVHMLLRVGQIPLYKFMQGLQQSYTQYFNKKNKLVGHVFQGRYKDIFVDQDEYLLELIRYIHLNPVKDGLASNPLDYRWSSHRAYFVKNCNTFVHTYFVKQLLAEYGGTVIDDYRLVPEAIPRLADTPGQETGPCLQATRQREFNLQDKSGCVPATAGLKNSTDLTSGPGHILPIKGQLETAIIKAKQLGGSGGCLNAAGNPVSQIALEQNKLDAILQVACSALDVNPDLVVSPGRQPQVVKARKFFIYLSCRQAGYRIREVAEFLGCSDINISKSLKSFEEKGVGLKLSIITE